MLYSRRVSIKDIAKAAGVSYSTVSRALHDSPLISQEVRKRIQSIADAMGYTPNALAQSLQSRRSNSIGLVITTISDPFFADVAEGIEEVARNANMSVFLAISNNDPEQEIKIIRNLNSRRVDGVIVAASRVGRNYGRRFDQVNIPVILINNQVDGEFSNQFSLSIDDFGGACKAVKYLLELGHRRIGYIGPNNRPVANNRRLKGYQNTLEEAGIPVLKDRIYISESQVPEGLSGDMRVGREGLNFLKDKVTAIFCCCDSIAAGTVVASREAGISVPEELSIIGFDDIDLCNVIYPTLTTVHQPRLKMGKTAMEMLISSLEGCEMNDLLIEPELVVRASTAPPPNH
jgi:DNA-binding LacI/PurR family transcriptional regulator